MKTITVSRRAWYVRFAMLGREREVLDLCEFIRSFLSSTVVCLIFGTLVVPICLGVADVVAYVAYMIIHWTWMEPSVWAALTLMVPLFIAAVAGATVLLIHVLTNPPEILTNSVESVRNRVCFRIDIK